MRTIAKIILIMLMIGGATMARTENTTAGTGPLSGKLEKATFAGGCFWCMQPPFDKQAGVVSTTVGYTGGRTKDPTYEEVSSGRTGHAEAIEVLYDPAQVSYDRLLDVFWHNVDPTVKDRQFVDVGSQYRAAIFYHNEEQHRLALASKEKLARSGKFGTRPILTEIVPVGPFYPAEEYHQNYYKKNGVRYKFYRFNSGRDQFLERAWGTDNKE